MVNLGRAERSQVVLRQLPTDRGGRVHTRTLGIPTSAASDVPAYFTLMPEKPLFFRFNQAGWQDIIWRCIIFCEGRRLHEGHADISVSDLRVINTDKRVQR